MRTRVVALAPVLLMALSFAHGSLLWDSADPALTTYQVSGLSFQPKALMFFMHGLASGVDASSETENDRRSIGFASSATARRCFCVFNPDASANADCNEAYRTDAVLIAVSSVPAITAQLDLKTIDADGFTLEVDDAIGTSATVFWFAWGGTDITNAATGEIVEPAATGNQSYTVTGPFQPTIVLFAGCQLTAAPHTVGAQDTGLMIGAATGTGAGNQFVLVTNSDDGSASMDTDQYMRGDECLAMITVAGGNPNARATFNGFDAAGFDLNWLARGLTDRRYIYLAIAGGSNWKVGTGSIDIGAVGNTTTISGLSFRPDGALVVAHGWNAEQSAGLSFVNGSMNVGCFSSPTSRRGMGLHDENGTATVELNHIIEYDEVIAIVGSSGAIDTLVDIDVVNNDGFRLITDQITSPGSTFFGYVTSGNPPPASLVIPPRTFQHAHLVR